MSIVSFRGGKLYHEHVYWDQASVLLQVGLLDRENIPRAMKEKGLKVLPVAGKESARKVSGSQNVLDVLIDYRFWMRGVNHLTK